MPAATKTAATPVQGLSTRLLSRRQVAELLDLEACIGAVEEAWIAHARGRSIPPGVLGAHVEGGGFHLKTAGLTGTPAYFAAKLNGNFFDNEERFGLPRIQGLVILCDAIHGYPLAVMDSIEITALRTAAATAVAAKHLALPEADTVTICGCGRQGRAHLEALRHVRPIRQVYAFDVSAARATRFAEEAASETGLAIEAVGDLRGSTSRSSIIVTCTPSREPLLGAADVAPGAFVGAVGADSEEKQELHPSLLAAARLVADSYEQCAQIGELHHALAAGAVPASEVPAELHEVISGARPGRESPDEIVVYDSTGVALQDVAAAVLVYERATAAGVGRTIDLLG